MKLDALRSQFRGEILTPESPRYESGRRLWNGMIDRYRGALRSSQLLEIHLSALASRRGDGHVRGLR
jgi:hypothetical protein